MGSPNNGSLSSIVIRLETLNTEYDILLAQYQEAQKTYINNLRKPKDVTDYTSLKGRTWWGTGGITSGSVNSEQECQDMCVSNDKCTGAVFNPVKKYCWTRKGNNPLSPGLDTDYALIPTLKANNIVLQSLNDRLVQKAKAINTLIANSKPELKELYKDKTNQYNILNINYKELADEKVKLLKDIAEYNTLSANNSDNTLEVNKEVSVFQLWTILAAIILILLITQLLGFGNGMKIIMFLLIIIGIISLTYALKTPGGFAICGLVIIGTIYYYMNR